MPNSFEKSLPPLTPREYEIVNSTRLVSQLKTLQGNISLASVHHEQRALSHQAFGGIVAKTISLSVMNDFTRSHLPEEVRRRAWGDSLGMFYRLHFLPFGSAVSTHPGEALQALALGALDLYDFLQWLEQEKPIAADRLDNRTVVGEPTYPLGLAIKKHLPVFQVFAESKPTDTQNPLDHALLLSEQSSPFYSMRSSWMVLGTFVPELIQYKKKLHADSQQLISLVQKRYQQYRHLSNIDTELELRRQAILRSHNINHLR